MSAIIFDFDGTIADSFDYVVEFLTAEVRAAPLDVAARQALRGLSMPAIARQFGLGWWRLPRLLFKGRRHMNARQIKPFAGMPEIVRKLHAEGHELFMVSSNSVTNLHEFLHAQDLHTYFLEIYGGIGVFGKAPALRKLAGEQQLDVRNCLYVGDEIRDVEAAQSINMPVVAVTWGFARTSDLRALNPTAIAEQPEDILRLVSEL